MKILSLLIFFAFVSCKTTGDEQSRAFIEGTVTTNLSTELIELQLKSENTIVSKTLLSSSKNFAISGPLLGKTYFLVCNQKIKAISGNDNLKISKDSLSIEFPAGLNYINNLELKLNK